MITSGAVAIIHGKSGPVQLASCELCGMPTEEKQFRKVYGLHVCKTCAPKVGTIFDMQWRIHHGSRVRAGEERPAGAV